ncbi:MAG: hypothetical protein AABX72_01670 [Nanoarchaeota archaeon]
MPQLTEPLIEQVMQLMEQGYQGNDILSKLQEQGFSSAEVQDALSQAQTKASVESNETMIPPPPPMPQMQPSLLNREAQRPIDFTPSRQEIQSPQQFEMATRNVEEKIEEVAEAIIEEKWRRVMEDMGDLSNWKEKVKTEIISIKQEVLRLENRFDGMQQAILGRVKEYDKQVEDVGTDVKALEKLLQSILKPLSDNVKELKRVTEKLQK